MNQSRTIAAAATDTAGREKGAPVTTRYIGAVIVATTATSLASYLLGALAVEISHSLRLTLPQLGVTVSTYSFTMVVGLVPAGRLAERVGGARQMRVAAGGSGVALLLLAGLAHSWASLTGLVVVAGLASAAMQPATTLFVVEGVREGRQGLAFGARQAAVPLATMLAGLAVPAVALTIGWRLAFVFAAGVSAMAIVVVPRGVRHVRPVTRIRGHSGLSRPDLMSLIVFSLGFGLANLAVLSLTTFLVVGLVSTGMGEGAAGWIAALGGGAAVIARVAAGWFGDQRRHDPILLVARMILLGAFGFLTLALGFTTRVVAVSVVGVVLTFGAGWGWNGLFFYVVARHYLRAPAQATALVQTGGQLLGMVGPATVGLIVGMGSFTLAWLASGGVAAGAVVAMLVGRHLSDATSRAGDAEGERTPSVSQPGEVAHPDVVS